MKALVNYGLGAGEMEIRDVPTPTVGDDDVLMEVRAAGICGSDVGTFDHGGHPAFVFPPVIVGHEFAGVVARTGKNVTAWKVGDRIVSENTGYVCGKCHACSTGDFVICAEKRGLGYGMDGGFTNFVRIPGQVLKIYPDCLFRIPDNVTFEEAAILDPACNSYKAILQESNFKAGENIVIFGAGPIGLLAVQIAKIAGAANIILIGLKEDKLKRFEQARKFGATHTLAAEEENVTETIKSLAGSDGIPVVIDCAGAPVVLKQALEIARHGGEIIRVGMSPQPPDFSLDVICAKSITLKGHFGYDTDSWKNCITLLEKKILDMNSLITHRMPLSDWKKGFELVKDRTAIKVILYPE